MFRKQLFFTALLASLLVASSAHAGLTFELLHGPCWTGNKDLSALGPNGEVPGGIDCYNQDFNGGTSRTTLSFKVFQPWEFGSVFLYYDITGPFTSALANDNTLEANERGGFFGGIAIAVSAMQIGQKITGKPFQWGPINDLSFKYEMEHVSKLGMLHYYGLQWGISVPFMDFVSVTTVIRNDTAFEGIDLQLGGAWQKSFSLLSQDFVFAGFLQWGVFGEGKTRNLSITFLDTGHPFLMTQPQLMWDFGKLARFTPGKLFLGVEWQFTVNRYLIPGKTENTLQGMFRWNL